MIPQTKLMSGVQAVTDPLTGGIKSISSGGRLITSAAASRRSCSQARPTIVSFGNSISRLNSVSLTTTNQVPGDSYLYWMQAFLGWPFKFARTGAIQQIGASATSTLSYGVYGYGGGTTFQMMELPEDPLGALLAYYPDAIFIQTMENDVADVYGGGHTVSEYLALYQTIVSRCEAVGTQVIWGGCLPSLAFTSASHGTAYWGLEHGVQDMAAINPGMIYVPLWDLYMDGSLTYPAPLSAGSFSGYTDATVHPSRASPLIGKRFSDVLSQYGWNNLSRFIVGPGDARYMASGNVNMSGSGGTLGGSFTGSAPAGMTVTNDLTTPTAAASLPIVEGRQVLQVDVSAGAQSGYKNAVQLQGGSVASGFSIGDYVQAYTVLTIRSSTTPAGIMTPQQQLRFVGGANDGWSNIGTVAARYMFPLDTPMMVASPELQIPASTTGVRSLSNIYCTSGASSVALSAYVHSQGLVNWSK